MTNIIPIHGLRFSPKAGLDYSQIITQPYDIISSVEQEIYYEKSPFNVIRLEYAKSLPGDNNSNNKYTRAAHTLQQWLGEGILFQEEKPALYFYEQHFPWGDKNYLRCGLFCGVELSPFETGNIIPHEKTLDRPKADRLELMNHCQANFSPIFGLYDDKDEYLKNEAATLKKEKPIIDFTDVEGQTHRVWAVTDPSPIAAIQEFFREKKIFIADGHHRYETALEFYQQKSRTSGDLKKYNYALMALVNIYDDGLLSFPTHRLVKQNRIKTGDFLSRLVTNFSLQELKKPENSALLRETLENFLSSTGKEGVSLGLYTEEGKLYGLKLKKSRKFFLTTAGYLCPARVDSRYNFWPWRGRNKG
ncbi:MAG: DUF1015 domain-containing protein [Dethiobacteria bacterium]|jgi:uncharacterized protein (DUF1015 family)